VAAELVEAQAAGDAGNEDEAEEDDPLCTDKVGITGSNRTSTACALAGEHLTPFFLTLQA